VVSLVGFCRAFLFALSNNRIERRINYGCKFYSYRIPFECVKLFTGFHEVDFWFAASGKDRESLFRGLGEEKLGEVFRPLIGRYFEINREWFVGGRIPDIGIFYTTGHRSPEER
jgi:hypothetical protein